jgi:hypothetical protein
MKSIRPLLDKVLREAIAAVRSKGVRVYTFAFYHDHESRAVSVCVDTEESSKRLVASSNAFSQEYFWSAISDSDLKAAGLWNANTGGSLSLGDFALVNLARTDLPRGRITAELYLEMIRATRAMEPEIVALATSPESLLFCTSGANDEVAFTWAPQLSTA